MSSSNVYNVLGILSQPEIAETATLNITLSGLSLADDDQSDEDIEEEAFYTPFNLVQLDSKLGHQPIFTRDLLQQIQKDKAAVFAETRKLKRSREFYEIRHPSRSGDFAVWKQDEQDSDYDLYNSNSVTVSYMSRVALHPEFQRSFGKYCKADRLLRVANGLQGKTNWISSPYALELNTLASSRDHESNEIMCGYWNRLQRTKSLWVNSDSHKRICTMADNLASTHETITKIVCFGLGALSHREEFYDSSLQHMTAFTIANRLTKAYKARSPGHKPVEVILQDPCYTRKDKSLLQELHKGIDGKLSRAHDPDGLLAIDSQSIVIAAFLPVEMPLMQIIADMFHGQEREGPAAIICDNVEVDPERALYTFTDRASPPVAKFLTQRYVESDFEDHVLEQEVLEDVPGPLHLNTLTSSGLDFAWMKADS